MQVALRKYRGRTPIYLHRICITRTLDVVTFSRSFVRSFTCTCFFSSRLSIFFSHLDCLKRCRGAIRFRPIISLDLILFTAHSRHWHEISYCRLFWMFVVVGTLSLCSSIDRTENKITISDRSEDQFIILCVLRSHVRRINIFVESLMRH